MPLRGARSRVPGVVLIVVLASCAPGRPGGNPSPPAVVPRFAYVVDTVDAISSYAVEPSSGQLRHNGYALSPVSTAGLALGDTVAPALVVNPLGFLYWTAGKTTTPRLLMAAIDGPTGRLTPRALTWTPGRPLDVVGHPSGRFLYILQASTTTFEIHAAAVDASTGSVSPAGQPRGLGQITHIHAMAVDPQGKFLLAAGRGGALPTYLDVVETIAIDPANGETTGVWRRATVPFEPGGVALHPAGRCGVARPFVAGATLAGFSIAANGAPANAVITTTAAPVQDLAFDRSGSTLFALDRFSVTAFPVTDATTCALGSPVAPVALSIGSATRFSIDPSGRYVYVTSPSFNMVETLSIGDESELTLAGTVTTRNGLTGFAPVFTTGARPVSYLPRFLYVVDYKANSVSIFSIGTTSGALTSAGTRGSLGTGPFAIAVDPWSRFAYVANRDSASVAAFTIDRSTGALSATSVPVAVGTRPVALAIESSGRFLFVASNGSKTLQVFGIDQSTGHLSSAGAAPPVPTGSQPRSLVVDPTGSTLLVGSMGAPDVLTSFNISQTAGLLTAIGPSVPVAIGGYTGIGVDARGSFVFLGDTAGGAVQTRPIDTLTATVATWSSASVPSGKLPVSVAVDPLGRFVYTANDLDFSVSTYSIDRFGYGTVTPGTPVNLGLSPPKFPRAAIVDPSGRYVYVADEMGRVFSFAIDPATGALSATGSVKAGIQPFALGIARLPI